MTHRVRPPRAAPLLLVLLASACGRGDAVREAQGTVEIPQMDAAPLQPARLLAVRVREGDRVQAGDTLAVLSQAVASGEVGVREGAVRQAQARLAELRAGPRPAEVARAQAELSAAQAEAERAARDVERLRPLLEHGNVSRQQFDLAQTAARAASRRSEAARQVVLLLRQGTRGEEIQVAEAQLASARAALGTSRETVAELVLIAPAGGLVTGRFAEPGEVVGAGQAVVSVGDAQHPFTRVYVGPDVLTRLRLGQAVQARLDGVERDFSGRISALAEQAEFTPRVALTERERADLLFAVRVEFPGAPPELKAGLPVSVRFPQPPR